MNGDCVPSLYFCSSLEKYTYPDAVGQVVEHRGFKSKGFSSHHRVGESEF